MKNREKLYMAFANLLYAISMADGNVQEVERDTLKQLLREHGASELIVSSFDKNRTTNLSPDEAYHNALEACIEFGPDPEYMLLMELMYAVAKSYMGIVPEERIMLNEFINDLKNRFS